jgi:hypothetical protein
MHRPMSISFAERYAIALPPQLPHANTRIVFNRLLVRIIVIHHSIGFDKQFRLRGPLPGGLRNVPNRFVASIR